MSILQPLPERLTRRARHLLDAALRCIGDDGEVDLRGKPPSAMTTLCQETGICRQNIRIALRELEKAGLATTRREGKHGALRVRFAVVAIVLGDACLECGSPAKGTGRWCARCKQVFGRDDRSWMIRALELHDLGHSPRRIAVILDRPLWAASQEDGRDPNGGAVVPFLLGKGVLGPEWARRLREATSSHVEDA